MNTSVKIVGIIVILVIVAGTGLYWTINKSATTIAAHTTTTPIPTPSNEKQPQVETSPVQTVIVTPKSTLSSTQYTAEFKAKVRATFIANCKTKLGQQYESNCICGADY
jgi:hypothetical protein